ncbi:hypothetical protein [Gardnerella vaginalis]|uniref:hypothetical protein n=1 Tax=Gardnerella vaginalis TaxID=2702 RepID=UPI00094D583E|nr:hypothetical protein [Gardnerella vaginalis]
MKRRIGCWIALAFAFALAIFVRYSDRYGFTSAIVIFAILPLILFPINIVASFDKKLLIEVPIISILITFVLEVFTFKSGNDFAGYFGYLLPTLILSAVAFTLTRFLKTKLVKRINDEIANNKTD